MLQMQGFFDIQWMHCYKGDCSYCKSMFCGLGGHEIELFSNCINSDAIFYEFQPIITPGRENKNILKGRT